VRAFAHCLGEFVLGARQKLAASDLVGKEEFQRLDKARLALAVSTPESGDSGREIKELLDVSEAAETLQFNSAELGSGHHPACLGA
jgi:hypothetical protein